MKTQYEDWNLNDFTFEQIKDLGALPNWVKFYISKSEALDGIMAYMAERQGLFDSMGIQGNPVKRKKSEKKPFKR